jgi:DNA invertase Pin-like site-specific DNA recombinase
MGKLVFSVLAAIAEFERELIRERVVAGMKEAGRQGKHCGRPAKKFDIGRAAELRQSGLSWRKLETTTGIPMRLLRHRLASAQGSRGQKTRRLGLTSHIAVSGVTAILGNRSVINYSKQTV